MAGTRTAKAPSKIVATEENYKENAEEIDESLLTETPDGWEFETVAEESAITVIMEHEGDRFIGQFIGEEHIAPEENGKQFDAFDRYTFRGQDGRVYAMNQSYKLKQAFESVAEGDWVRITLVKFIPSSKGNDIKDYRVEVRRR